MSFTTIGPEGPWEYLPVLNECLKILLTIVLGMIMSYFKIFQAKTFVPNAVRFVFYAALPLLILKGLGIGIDFYDDTFLWSFICAFLILRAVALAFSFAVVLRRNRGDEQERKSIGQVAVMWLALTWISTVILGVPISSAVFGDPSKGRSYGILAGISSFIFQLPLQLLFLECHLLEQHYRESQNMSHPDVEQALHETSEDSRSQNPNKPDLKEETAPPRRVSAEKSPLAEEDEAISPNLLWLRFAKHQDVWRRILVQVLQNPVLWGIAGGFILSLSTVGPRFLNPKSDEFIPGLGWFATTTGWFGNCVSPVSLFAMGVWAQDQGKQLFSISLQSVSLFMISKLVLVPLLMVGLSKALGLNDEAGRAAVLISSLPISMASFSLASRYKIGEAVLSENVAVGTVLVLPTVLLWNLVMDALDLFPIKK